MTASEDGWEKAFPAGDVLRYTKRDAVVTCRRFCGVPIAYLRRPGRRSYCADIEHHRARRALVPMMLEWADGILRDEQ